MEKVWSGMQAPFDLQRAPATRSWPVMENSEIRTYQALVSCFSEFLLVAVHTILAERNVYPRESFVKARKWSHAVFQSRHAGVSTWIDDAVAAVEKQMLKGTVKQVSLVLFSPSSVPLERFVFNTSRFPLVSEDDLLTSFRDDQPATASGDDEHEHEHEHDQSETDQDAAQHLPAAAVVDLNAQFRGLLSRLCQLSQSLPPLPPKCTYTIAIEMRDKPLGRPPIERLSAFIPSESQLQSLLTNTVRTTPLRSVDAGIFLMETWVEETQAKLDSADQIAREAATAEDEANRQPEKPVDPLLEAMEGKTYVK